MKSHNYYNTITTKIIRCLFVCLLLQSCHGSSKNFGTDNSKATSPSEVIMFCGNPGVGKSTLCNSIFGQVVFKSGLNLFTGLTTVKQSYLHEGKSYIDTPGLDDAKRRGEAAREIEQALKQNNYYKIIFVAKLDSGRIRYSDLATINLICAAIKAPFEYGIVINQVAKEETSLLEKAGVTEKHIIDFLSESDPVTKKQILIKRPTSIVILEEDGTLKNADNKYLQGNSENRGKLLNFINNLRANKIDAKDVEDIDTRSIDEIINDIENKYKDKFDQAMEDAKGRGCKCIVS